MSCEYCGQIPHHPRCPLVSEVKSNHYCSICDEPVLYGERYVENYYGDYAHYKCLVISGVRDTLDWLDIKIKEIDD